jgi:hypothetical protein
MTTALFDFPSSGVDDQTRSLLDLIAGDPLHAEDRRKIIVAIVRDARRYGGRVDTNRVRAQLMRPGTTSLVVYPRLVGAVFSALANRGVLVPMGWTINEDRHGKNHGKPLRAWRFTAPLGPVDVERTADAAEAVIG